MVNNKRLVKWFNCKASAIQKIKRHGFCNEMDLASVLENTTGQKGTTLGSDPMKYR